MRVACQICQADGAANLLFLLTCERYPEVPAVNGIIDYAEEGALQAILCARGGRTDLRSGLRGASHPPRGAPQFSDGPRLVRTSIYLTSTFAPAASIFFLMSSASCLVT